MDGHAGRNEENRKGDEPMPGDRTDRQADDDTGNMGAADGNQMNEPVIHRLVRREVVALRRRVFGLPVIRHSILQNRSNRPPGLSANARRGQRYPSHTMPRWRRALSPGRASGSMVGSNLVEPDGRERLR